MHFKIKDKIKCYTNLNPMVIYWLIMNQSLKEKNFLFLVWYASAYQQVAYYVRCFGTVENGVFPVYILAGYTSCCKTIDISVNGPTKAQ